MTTVGIKEKAMATTTSTKKRERVSFSGSRRRLSTELIPELAKAYRIRWFNDTSDRIDRAINGGYEFVLNKELDGRVGDKEVHGGNSDLNDKVSKIVTPDPVAPVRAYLLKIRNEFWEEDKAEHEARNNLIDEAIRAGTSGGASVAKSYGDVSLTRG